MHFELKIVCLGLPSVNPVVNICSRSRITMSSTYRNLQVSDEIELAVTSRKQKYKLKIPTTLETRPIGCTSRVG